MPTEYGGRLFRSRLEARWAAFFDLAWVGWEYEPDADFKGWWPDFLVKGIRVGDGTYNVYAEVKPVDYSPISIDRAFNKALRERWTLMLGRAPEGDFIGFLACKRDGQCQTMAVRLTDDGLQAAPYKALDYACHAERVWKMANDHLPKFGVSVMVDRVVRAYTGASMFDIKKGRRPKAPHPKAEEG